MDVYARVNESGQYVDPPLEIIAELGLVLMDSEPPSAEHVAQSNGTWALTEEKREEMYQAELATLDPLQLHILRHERNGELERAARAELEFNIAQAEILEKYGRGDTVYVTESGSCYHTSQDCLALANATSVKEIKMSEGLKKYSPCSICKKEN